MEDLVKVLVQCQSDDNDLRGEAEQVRDSLLHNQTYEFLMLLIEIICNENYKNIRNYCIVVLFSIFKRQITLLTPEIEAAFFESYNSKLLSLLNSPTIHQLVKGWIVSIYSYLLSLNHKFQLPSHLNINDLVAELSKNIDMHYVITIVSESIDNSDDLCQFTPETILYLLQNFHNYPLETIDLYFSVVSKVPDVPQLLELFEQILKLIETTDVPKAFRIICNFCEKGAEFMSQIIMPLSKFIKEKILAMNDNQVMIQGLYILSTIVQYSTEIVRVNPEFISDLVETFVNVLETNENVDTDDGSASCVAKHLIPSISQKLYFDLTPKISEIAETVIYSDDCTQCYGLMLLMTELDQMFFPESSCVTKLPSMIVEILQTEMNYKYRYVCFKLLGQFSSMSHYPNIQEIKPALIELSLLEVEQQDDLDCIRYLAASAIDKFIKADSLHNNRENSLVPMYDEIRDRFIQVLQTDSFESENAVAQIIETLGFIFTKKAQETDVNEVMQLFHDLYESFSSSYKVRCMITSCVSQYLCTIYEINQELHEIISNFAKQYYDECRNIISQEDVPPELIIDVNNASLSLLPLLGEHSQEYFNDLVSTCAEILQQKLEFQDISKNEFYDLTAFYVVDNVAGSNRFLIEKSKVEILENAFSTLYKLTTSPTFYTKIMEDNQSLFHVLVETLCNFIENQFFVEKLTRLSFGLLIGILENIIAYSQGENELINSTFAKITEITKLMLNMSWTNSEFDQLLNNILLLMKFVSNQIVTIEGFKELMFAYGEKATNIILKSADTFYQNCTDQNNCIQFFEEVDMFMDHSIHIFNYLAKKAPEFTIESFKERIWPQILQLIQLQRMNQYSIVYLINFMSWDSSSAIYNELHQILFNMLSYRPTDPYNVTSVDPERFSPQTLVLKRMFENAFFHLFRMIKRVNIPNELGWELQEVLKSLLKDESLIFIGQQELTLCLYLIYTKYITSITPEIMFPDMYMFISTEIQPLTSIDSKHSWAISDFYTHFILKFYPQLIEILHADIQSQKATNVFEDILINITFDDNLENEFESLSKNLVRVLRQFNDLLRNPQFTEIVNRFLERATNELKMGIPNPIIDERCCRKLNWLVKHIERIRSEQQIHTM